MRGVDSFPQLWTRREEFELPGYELLRDLGQRHPELVRRVPRVALRAAMEGDADRAAGLLRAEEDRERQRDRLYRAPRRSELERWRRARPRQDR
jgi:hypothetical protein